MSGPSDGAIPLVFASPDQPMVCVEVHGGHALRQRLAELGILPGTELTLLRPPADGGPVLVHVRGTRLALGRGMAQKVFVAPA